MTKFYVDSDGKYLGGYDGATPPAGAIEVSTPPANGRDRYINGHWVVAGTPLPISLILLLNSSAAAISTQLEADPESVPAGLLTKIMGLSSALQELARIVPESVYAREAEAAIEELGILPEPLEDVRQQMLTLIQA